MRRKYSDAPLSPDEAAKIEAEREAIWRVVVIYVLLPALALITLAHMFGIGLD